jgi:hypothetical protein
MLTMFTDYTLNLNSFILFVCCNAVMDVAAFERLLGPCMEIMKRNIGTYNQQLQQIFGTK